MKKFSILLILLAGMFAAAAHLEQHIKEIQGAGPVKVVRTTDFDMDVSRDHFPNMFLINKFAYNPKIDTATVPEDIWYGGGLYTGFPLTDVETLEVFSASANDSSAGTGCRTLAVYGLDANYDLQNEIVTLSGIIPVDTANTYTRVYRALCVTAGSGGKSAGDITIRHTITTANLFAVLEAATSSTQLSNFTVPNNYHCYIRHYEVGLNDNTANRAVIAIWMRPFGGAELLVNRFMTSTEFHSNYYPPGASKIEAKTDIVMRVQSVKANGAEVAFTGTILCVREELE